MDRTKFIVLTYIIFLFANCNLKDDSVVIKTCNVSDPLTELDWLAQLKQEVDNNCSYLEVSIFQGVYENQPVFYQAITDPRANIVFHIDLLNCQGETIKTFGESESADFGNSVTNRLKLFSCVPDGKVCNANNPIDEINWLSDLKSQIENSNQKGQIIKYTYQNNHVFWVDLCYECEDNLIQVYNCEGSVICEFVGIGGINTCLDFTNEATRKVILFDNTDN